MSDLCSCGTAKLERWCRTLSMLYPGGTVRHTRERCEVLAVPASDLAARVEALASNYEVLDATLDGGNVPAITVAQRLRDLLPPPPPVSGTNDDGSERSE